jgi:NADPH-dependent ferric siderophore reductase
MSTARPTDTASLLARLAGTQAFILTLETRNQLGPSLVSLGLRGLPADLNLVPGQDLMLAVPVEQGDGSFRRRYTVRRQDPTTGAVELWIHTAAGGPGTRWAVDAPIGSTIEAIGPRGKITLDAVADWHLFIGDLSFVSAAYAMAETIEAPGQALFVFEIDEDGDEVLPELDEGIGVTLCLLPRDGRAIDDPSGLLIGLKAIEFPEDVGHVYLGGELSVVAELRRALGARGLTKEQISAKSYYRAGASNAAHGEPKKDAHTPTAD